MINMRDKSAKLYAKFMYRGTPALGLAVAIYYNAVLFQNYKADTTAITNIAFLSIASLAALAFACAQALPNKDKARDRVTYAGERLFHASILLLLASMLKYAVLSLQKPDLPLLESAMKFVLSMPFQFAVPFLFLWAILNTYTGLRVLSEVLWWRTGRHDDWDRLP